MRKSFAFAAGLLVAVLGLAIISWTFEAALAGAGQQRNQASGASQALPTAYRIAVVNRKEAFDKYKRQQTEWAKLDQELQSKQAILDKQSDDITAARKRVEEDTTLPAAEKERLAQQVQSDFVDYQADFKKLQAEIDAQSRKFFRDMMADVDEAVRLIGSEGNYHLILEADPDPRSGSAVLHFSATIDITPQVVVRLNQ